MPIYAEYGRVHYTVVSIENYEKQWSYSTTELKKTLEETCLNQKLERVYVHLNGYLQAFHYEDNEIDLTYMGGPTLLVFEKVAIVIDIMGEGLVRFGMFPIWELKRRDVFDYSPDDMLMNETYYFDAGSRLHLEFENQRVLAVSVKATTIGRAFNTGHGFDRDKADCAEKAGELPNAVEFHLANGNTVYLVGDDIENYWVGVAPAESGYGSMEFID